MLQTVLYWLEKLATEDKCNKCKTVWRKVQKAPENEAVVAAKAAAAKAL